MLLVHAFSFRPAQALATAGTHHTLTDSRHTTLHRHIPSASHTSVHHFSSKHTRNAYTNHCSPFFLFFVFILCTPCNYYFYCNIISLFQFYSVTLLLSFIPFLLFVFLYPSMYYLSYSCYLCTLPVCIACLDTLYRYLSL